MRKRKKSELAKGGIGIALVIAGLYLGWCAINYYQTKEWSWTPWKQLGLGSIQLIGR